MARKPSEKRKNILNLKKGERISFPLIEGNPTERMVKDLNRAYRKEHGLSIEVRAFSIRRRTKDLEIDVVRNLN